MDKNKKDKSTKIEHQFAYTKDNPTKPLTAKEEDARVKQYKQAKDTYYSYNTGEELELISEYTKKKINKKTGEPIKVRAHFKVKEKSVKGKRIKREYKEDGQRVISEESLLHSLGKAVFEIHKPLTLKGFSISNRFAQPNRDIEREIVLLQNRVVDIHKVEFEKIIKLKDSQGNQVIRKPDVALECYDIRTRHKFTLYVEIAVTHKKTPEDIALFALNNLNIIEIDLKRLIPLMNNIGDEEGQIKPEELLSDITLNVLNNINNQTWLNLKLRNEYLEDIEKVKVHDIFKANHRDKGQKGFIKLHCPYDGNENTEDTVTIVNFGCMKNGCGKFRGTSGDMEYIMTDKTMCEVCKQPVIICSEIDCFDDISKQFKFKAGHENL